MSSVCPQVLQKTLPTANQVYSNGHFWLEFTYG